MSWHFLERWLERANQHSTLIGKFWITYLIVCRMVIIGSIGKLKDVLKGAEFIQYSIFCISTRKKKTQNDDDIHLLSGPLEPLHCKILFLHYRQELSGIIQ